jgi:hypothetical protein
VCLVVLACERDSTPAVTTVSAASPSASPSVAAAAVASAGGSVAPAGSAAASTTASGAGAAAPSRPFYYEREIGEEELEGRTLRELALMRNTIYARAGNSFRRPWLDAYFRAQPWYQPKAELDESKISAIDRKNARKIADHDAGISREELEKRRDEVLARRAAGAATAEDAVELSLLSQRLGTWLGGSADSQEPPTPLEDHSQLDRLLKVEELSTLSRRDLRILRNTIYARHGRMFDSAVVRGYFEGARWYKPSDSYHDGVLTAVDHKNIRIIQSVEESLGGPLHENPNYGKDGWFVMA